MFAACAEKVWVATILLVDDIHPVRALFRRLLEQQGHRVIEAENGLAAAELYSAEQMDLVISDLDMPRMRGDELIRRICPSRFLIVSSDPSGIPDDWPRLMKPVRGAEFLAAVRRCLEE
jgi:response regulator RpfG family c-di-GMP phosphodiesterase